MEESAIDLMMDAPGNIAPMTIEAALILALMIGVVAWGIWAKKRDQKR